MPPDYELLPDAINDVLDLGDYARDYGDEALERPVDAVYDCFERLAEFPGLGRDRSDLLPGLRGFALNRQRVTIYYLGPEGERRRLTILRVLRQERDVSEDDFK